MCCKVLESILKDNIVEHLKCNNLINDFQHGLSINQSIKFISNQIKKFDIQCTLYNIHGKLFYNKHVATFFISD